MVYITVLKDKVEKNLKKDNIDIEKELLLINTYRGSGIGDFGLALKSKILDRESISLEYLETKPSWTSFVRIWSKIRLSNSPILFNLGFTSYGKSSVRNFFNFLMIGGISLLWDKNVKVILHDSPEIFENNFTGYKLLRIKKMGGKIATRVLKNTKITVLSVELYRILKNKYRFNNVSLYPFPCIQNSNTRPNAEGIPLVISVGYIAPYKRLEILPEIKILMPGVKFMVVGKFHSVLGKTTGGREYKQQLESLFDDAGIERPGYVPLDELEKIISNYKCVGILPYSSTSGSSYAAAFFIERGVPLVASNLAEFQNFRDNGCGISITEGTVSDISKNLLQLINNRGKYVAYSKMNIAYSEKNSIDNMINSILKN